jgi:polyribonucleotide nucleotidyltransferase
MSVTAERKAALIKDNAKSSGDTGSPEVWGGRKLTLETGKIARQADGAVLATYGETACSPPLSRQSAEARPGLLPADRELPGKDFAAGKIPGGFFKREGRPTEKETLTSRLIDRPIRPLFVDGFKNEVQVVAPC